MSVDIPAQAVHSSSGFPSECTPAGTTLKCMLLDLVSIKGHLDASFQALTSAMLEGGDDMGLCNAQDTVQSLRQVAHPQL